MGNTLWGPTKLERALPEQGRFYGLENLGNTCFCNSVVQALQYCEPFREHVLQYYIRHYLYTNPPPPDTLLSCLGEMFYLISQQKKKTDTFSPRRFVVKLKRDNVQFRGAYQHDAQEFLNYLLNAVSETLQREEKEREKKRNAQQHQLQQQQQHDRGDESGSENGEKEKEREREKEKESSKTFVHEVFEGTLTNEIKCLCCETITSKDESFFDLSLEIEENASLTYCLRNFTSVELLHRADKFFCDTCNSLQEAQKCMKIKKLPNILIVHLKRFKYVEQTNAFRKLLYRVVFPFEFRLWGTSFDAEDAERYYDLFAVVVHIGSGPNAGHYVSFIKVFDSWILFDDEDVSVINEDVIRSVFGSGQNSEGFGGESRSVNTGYILFYKTRASGLIGQSAVSQSASSSDISGSDLDLQHHAD